MDLVWWEVVEKLGDLIVEQLLPGQSGPGNTVLKKRQARERGRERKRVRKDQRRERQTKVERRDRQKEKKRERKKGEELSYLEITWSLGDEELLDSLEGLDRLDPGQGHRLVLQIGKF